MGRYLIYVAFEHGASVAWTYLCPPCIACQVIPNPTEWKSHVPCPTNVQEGEALGIDEGDAGLTWERAGAVRVGAGFGLAE